MRYGASSILAYIVAARDKREAHAEDIWSSMQPQAGQHCNEQSITLDACIEEAIATLIEVNARVSDDLKSKRKAERGAHTVMIVRMMNIPPWNSWLPIYEAAFVLAPLHVVVLSMFDDVTLRPCVASNSVV